MSVCSAAGVRLSPIAVSEQTICAVSSIHHAATPGLGREIRSLIDMFPGYCLARLVVSHAVVARHVRAVLHQHPFVGIPLLSVALVCPLAADGVQRADVAIVWAVRAIFSTRQRAVLHEHGVQFAGLLLLQSIAVNHQRVAVLIDSPTSTFSVNDTHDKIS